VTIKSPIDAVKFVIAIQLSPKYTSRKKNVDLKTGFLRFLSEDLWKSN
jgi:hypothetical protein